MGEGLFSFEPSHDREDADEDQDEVHIHREGAHEQLVRIAFPFLEELADVIAIHRRRDEDEDREGEGEDEVEDVEGPRDQEEDPEE